MHCLRQAHRHPEFTDRTIWEVFEAERPELFPYAGRFDGFHAVPASVSKTCLVRFDNDKSVHAAPYRGRRSPHLKANATRGSVRLRHYPSKPNR
jgi:hypothetical protein